MKVISFLSPIAKHIQTTCYKIISNRTARNKLAFVSPLPPEKSGIADYSAELLPELSKYYDITVIIKQSQITDSWINNNCLVKESGWFEKNHHQFDRILYHIGNSHFHEHMPALIENAPGTVVLHDFFLGNIFYYQEYHKKIPGALSAALDFSHGQEALTDISHHQNLSGILDKYPVNLKILTTAKGIITHSEFSKKLATEWYRKKCFDKWKVIPLMRKPVRMNKMKSRKELVIKKDEFIITSFGLIDPKKQSFQILEAFNKSKLKDDDDSMLFFVGQNNTGNYGEKMSDFIRSNKLEHKVKIVGWTELPVYKKYIAASDIAVQLRTKSRGETSAAIMDCLNQGTATIVNANGSFAELPADAVLMLPDEFSQDQITAAIEHLKDNHKLRAEIGKKAKKHISAEHAPARCAKLYFEAIESFYNNSSPTA